MEHKSCPLQPSVTLCAIGFSIQKSYVLRTQDI